MKNERKRLHCISGQLRALRVILAQKTEVVIFPLAPTEKPIVPVDILSNRYLKNTLEIDYKKRLPCFCRYYGYHSVVVTAISGGFLNITWPKGGILGIKIIFMNKRNICCLTESRQWKHPKIIKGKLLIWLLFWFLWPSFLLLAGHNAMLGYR